jgi:alkanesulfonate monooxygenase SsuD/methylene tetrahydromethanopterin reductase-like flavin-dependent oxidoreductase (luciferase family)
VFYEVPAGRQAPRPVQHPGPAVLLGGMSRAAMERAGRLAEGWITSSRADLTKISEAAQVIRAAAAAAGRDPDAVRIICRGVVLAGAEAKGPDGDRRLLSGSYAQILQDTAWLAGQGVTELFYDLNWDPQIGNPEAGPQAAADRAGEILAELSLQGQYAGGGCLCRCSTGRGFCRRRSRGAVRRNRPRSSCSTCVTCGCGTGGPMCLTA